MIRNFIWCTRQIFLNEKTPDSCVSDPSWTILKIWAKNIKFEKSYVDFRIRGKNIFFPKPVTPWRETFKIENSLTSPWFQIRNFGSFALLREKVGNPQIETLSMSFPESWSMSLPESGQWVFQNRGQWVFQNRGQWVFQNCGQWVFQNLWVTQGCLGAKSSDFDTILNTFSL